MLIIDGPLGLSIDTSKPIAEAIAAWERINRVFEVLKSEGKSNDE